MLAFIFCVGFTLCISSIYELLVRALDKSKGKEYNELKTENTSLQGHI